MKNYDQGISLKNLLKSLKNALRGLYILIHFEYNLYIQIAFAFIAIIFGFIYNINQYEWMIQSIIIGFVIFAELINTAIEKIMDFVQPTYHKKVRDIKDLSAGAVLFTVFLSVVIGGIIYIPKIF